MKISQFEPFVGMDEYDAIRECFETNWLTEGPKSKLFSEKLLKLIGAKYGVFAQNGTVALYLGLRAMGIGPGDEVIVPNFTFIASANAVEMCGAKPVFVDIDRETFQMNVDDCDRVKNSKTKAIMPVHIFGLSANMNKIMEYARKNGLKVIEDAAQAIGVNWGGKHCGTFGEVGCFSFFADKTITTAEGGFVVTDDKEIYENMLYLRNQGRLNRGTFKHPEIGYNFRITDIQAAIGLVQIKKLDLIISRKQKILNFYEKELENLDSVRILKPRDKSNHVPFRVILVSSEPIEKLMEFMEINSIETRSVFYPLHKQPCYQNFYDSKKMIDNKNFPESNHAYEYSLCLPSYPTLEKEKIQYICRVIRSYYDKNTVSG